MSRKQRQSMIDREHRKVSLTRQCTLLDISRAWLYYQPTTPSAEDESRFLFHPYLLCEALALPCTIRARLAQATVRALTCGGCGDPRFFAVYHDQGRIGLPHPDPPK